MKELIHFFFHRIIKKGIQCIQNYAKECGTEMIAENFEDQFEKPAKLLTKICDPQSSVRRGKYLGIFLIHSYPFKEKNFRLSELKCKREKKICFFFKVLLKFLKCDLFIVVFRISESFSMHERERRGSRNMFY